ncbi:MAG TPA: LacI family transcriptional regulator, partial [Treponema sp.]|nr:LacI family transcriptional regulator [Treponema sp.]
MSTIPKRKKIGFQLQQMGHGYADTIWPGAVESAEALGVDLILFPGRNLHSPFGFDYQFNLVYQMMNKENIDALVLYTPLIGNFVGFEAIQKFCYGIKNIPLVSVGVSLPGIPSLIIDNKSGVREVVRHFVEVHHARRISFVKGPESNVEAEARLAAFREEMAAQSMVVDEKLIAQGDFTAFSTPAAIDELLGKCGEPPDAIMFANDEMALKGIEYLQEKGFNIPKDIAIIGFDDVSNCLISTPQLTSVRQSLNYISKKAVETALNMIEGKPVQEITTFPTTLVIRTSCGCPVESIKTFYSAKHNAKDIKTVTQEADSVYKCLVSLLSPMYLIQREEVILKMIGKLLAEEQLDSHIELQEFFQRILDREIRIKLVIKDWLHILIVISECVSLFKLPIEKDKEIQLKLRLCLLLAGEMNEVIRNIQTNTSNNSQNLLRNVLGNLSSIVHMD